MSVSAAVMTGKGTAAISTIVVFGRGAGSILQRIFKPAASKEPKLTEGSVLLGHIVEDGEAIDQVTIGCEGPENFAIHCHGNPLIVDMIMGLLAREGAEPTSWQRLLARIAREQDGAETLEVEAGIAQVRARTLEGTKIIINQINTGLGGKARQWLRKLDSIPLEHLKEQARQILDATRQAKLVMFGCSAVITGPANSGKSTLFNRLCGQDKAIVTDIEGTTRDWVSSECKIGPVLVELIDTAGFTGRTASAWNHIDEESQRRSIDLLEKGDLIILVLDGSRGHEQLKPELPALLKGKRVLTVLNKSDLPRRFDPGRVPQLSQEVIAISAKFGKGIDKLMQKIQHLCGPDRLKPDTAVCFTDRQERLLGRLLQAESRQQAVSVINELLSGQLCL